jgi:hypothetical protein
VTMPSRRVPGEHDDPYAERRVRIALVEEFAHSIPKQESIMDIAVRAGLPRDMIRTEPSPVALWTAVLERAVDEGRIDALLAEVTATNPRLADAVRHYQEARIS